MAEKWRYSSESNKKEHLDSSLIVSHGTEQALRSKSNSQATHQVLSLDIIFIILTFLPTELVLQLKTICRDWAKLISDPIFIRAHFSRPAPVTGFFIQTNRYCFNPFEKSPKFPSMITAFLSHGFKPTSTSHGLVCFQRNKDKLIIVVNPATSHWVVIPNPVILSPSPNCTCKSFAPNLIYDPATHHFKIAIATTYMTGSALSAICDHWLRFHIYSSDTSSWIVSSRYPRREKGYGHRPFDLYNCIVSRIAGGTVCWKQMMYVMGYDGTVCWKQMMYVMGYEIASDTHWMSLVPEFRNGHSDCRYLSTSRDGDIYCICFDDREKIKVLRLDEKKNWVLEGECNTEKIQDPQLYKDTSLACYDHARTALILEIKNTRELVALHLSSPKIEFVGKCESEHYGISLPHSNTLAPFHGSKLDNDGLNQLLHAGVPDDEPVLCV